MWPFTLGTKTVLKRVKSRFDPLEQNQTDRETDTAGGTGEGRGTKPVLERVKSRFDPPEQKQTAIEKDRETDRAGGTEKVEQEKTRNKSEGARVKSKSDSRTVCIVCVLTQRSQI